MKKITAICLSAFIGIGAAYQANAQGCSDPGLGMLGALKPGPIFQYDANGIMEDDVNSVALSVGYGVGENDVTYITPQLEYHHYVFPQGFIEAKLPFNLISGNLADVRGLGDVSVTYNHRITSDYSEKWTVTGTAGLRISLGNANRNDELFRPLPMAYQPNLGTTDVVVGINASFMKFLSVAVGYQQPVYQYNDNGYNRTAEVTGGEYIDYHISRRLYRHGDVMARLQGGYNGYRAGFMLGPQAIYHLGDDITTTSTGTEYALTGSQGLTLNAAANLYYRIPAYERKGYWQVDVTAGAPLMQRDYRPAGLTRDYVVIPRVTYFF